MADVKQSVIGVCPECGTTLEIKSALIAYQRKGVETYYAECGGCSTVVHPR